MNTNIIVEHLIQKHGIFICHEDLADLLKRHKNSFQYTLDHSNDEWVNLINGSRKKIGGRVYYLITALTPLFTENVSSPGDGEE